MRAIAWVLKYVTIYLEDPNGGAGVCGVINNSECDEVSIESVIAEIKRVWREAESSWRPPARDPQE
jgi:hypothetical protein